jgi:hypothetical protein
MPLRYRSGEEIRKGDRIRFHGEPGEIEFAAETIVGDPFSDWNLTTHGPGVMVLEPKFFGRAYIFETEENEDLEFVARKDA